MTAATRPLRFARAMALLSGTASVGCAASVEPEASTTTGGEVGHCAFSCDPHPIDDPRCTDPECRCTVAGPLAPPDLPSG